MFRGTLNNLLANSSDDVARGAAKAAAKTASKVESKLVEKASKYLSNSADDMYSFKNYIKRNRAGISNEEHYNAVKKILEDSGNDLSTLDNLLERNVFKDGTTDYKKPELYVKSAADNVKHGRVKAAVEELEHKDLIRKRNELEDRLAEEARQRYLKSPEYAMDVEYDNFKNNRKSHVNIPVGKESYFALKDKISPDILQHVRYSDVENLDDIPAIISAAKKNKLMSDAIQKDVDVANEMRAQILDAFKKSSKDTKWKEVKHSVSKSRYYDHSGEMPSEYSYDVPESVYDTARQLRGLRKKYQSFNDIESKFKFPFNETATPYRVTRYSSHDYDGWGSGESTRYENVPDDILQIIGGERA